MAQIVQPTRCRQPETPTRCPDQHGVLETLRQVWVWRMQRDVIILWTKVKITYIWEPTVVKYSIEFNINRHGDFRGEIPRSPLTTGELYTLLAHRLPVDFAQKSHATRNVMMTSSNGNIFRVTGHLCGEFTGPRWIPRTKASDAELWCFLWSASE